MKILMMVMAAHGHVNPMLPLVEELVAGGDEVVFLLPDGFAAGPRAAGATVRPIDERFVFDPNGMPNLATLAPEQYSEIAARFESRVRDMLEGIPDLRAQVIAESPDVVVYDPFSFWTPLLITGIDLPKVPAFPTYALADGVSFGELMARMNADKRSPFGVIFGGNPFAPLDVPFVAIDLNIVTLPRSFQPNAAEFDDRYLFVGPTMRTNEPAAVDFPLERLAGRRVVFVSLGTVVSDNPGFYRAAFDAFAGTDWLLVAATGRSDPAAHGPLPENVIARASVPQIAVLARSAVFVTHGGMNSTMEGLWHSVPLVVAPAFGDQPMNANRVEELGLGVQIDLQTATGETIRSAVDAVADDAAMRDRLDAMQSEIRTAGGAPRAAAALRAFVAAGSRELTVSGVN